MVVRLKFGVTESGWQYVDVYRVDENWRGEEKLTLRNRFFLPKEELKNIEINIYG